VGQNHCSKRGGFCYELNGLFAWLFTQIGFDVTYLTLLVRTPGQLTHWLVDVG